MSITVRSVKLLDDATRALAGELLATAARLGLPVTVFETFRGQERQNQLWEQGRSRPGPIVTKTRISAHTSRRAFDVVWATRKGPSWDEPWPGAWRELRAIGDELGLRPLIVFQNGAKDWPHFERTP